MRALLVNLALIAGCSYGDPDCADGYTRDAKGLCQAGSSDDSGDPELDSGEIPDPGASHFDGPIDINVLAETDALVLEDVCSGTVSLSVEDGLIDGTLSCVFQGTVGGIIGTDPFTGTLTGDVADDGSAAGPLDMDLGAFGALAASWSGTAGEEGVDGGFGEDTIFVIGALEVPVNYTGTFAAR
jgi:hypothetical protein